MNANIDSASTPPSAAEELSDVLHWRGKHAGVVKALAAARAQCTNVTNLLRMYSSRGLSPIVTEQELEAVDAALALPVYGDVQRSWPHIDAISSVLLAAWAKSEPDSPVVRYPVSYLASFVDMARAAHGEYVAPLLTELERLYVDIIGLRAERDTLKASAAEDKVVLATLSQQVTDYQGLAHDRKMEADPLKALLCEASEWIKQNSFHGTDAVELWERMDKAAPAAKDGAQ